MTLNAQTPRVMTGASGEVLAASGGTATASVAVSAVTPGDVTGLWASHQVTQLLDGIDDPVPEYGSLEWVQLPAGDPRKVAAIIAAAEEFRRYASEETWMDELHRRDPDAWHAELNANSYAPQKGQGARD